MKTTLDISDDVLQAAKRLSAGRNKSVGQLISELARKGLAYDLASACDDDSEFFGFRPFPSRGGRITNKKVRELRLFEGI